MSGIAVGDKVTVDRWGCSVNGKLGEVTGVEGQYFNVFFADIGRQKLLRASDLRPLRKEKANG